MPAAYDEALREVLEIPSLDRGTLIERLKRYGIGAGSEGGDATPAG